MSKPLAVRNDDLPFSPETATTGFYRTQREERKLRAQEMTYIQEPKPEYGASGVLESPV